MKHLLVRLLFTAIALGGSAQAETVLYHNATLINPALEQQVSDGWLLVKGGRIVQTGQGALPDAEQQYNLQGQFVLPGLIDAHLHLTAGPHRVEMQDGKPALVMTGNAEMTQYHALSTLAAGVTTIFNPAGEPVANADYSARQQNGEWRGPAMIYASMVFEPTPIVDGSVYPADEAGWRAEINRHKELGVQYIKLYQGLNKEELALGVALAKEAGLKTIAHLDSVSWKYAADLGIDALTHALPTSAELLMEPARSEYLALRSNPYDSRFIYKWFELVDFDSAPMQALFRTLAEQQIRVDLTAVVNELVYFYPLLDDIYQQQDMWVFHPTMRKSWRGTLGMSVYNWTEQDFALAQQQLPKVLELIRRMHQAGVPMLLGSDSFTSGPFLLREMQLHLDAGLTPWQVLQMATNTAAEQLGLGAETGQLTAGYYADFIVLAENPLLDISALQDTHTVVQRGTVHATATLKTAANQLVDATDLTALNSEK